MQLAWWALRLSSTSTSPRLVVLQKIFWPQLVVLSGTSRAQHIVRSEIFCNTTGALDLEDHAVEADAPDSLQPAPKEDVRNPERVLELTVPRPLINHSYYLLYEPEE